MGYKSWESERATCPHCKKRIWLNYVIDACDRISSIIYTDKSTTRTDVEDPYEQTR